MATIPPPAPPPRRRRIVPAAHLRLADEPKPETSTAKKGDVASLIRSMPNAPPQDVVDAGKGRGIVTTAGYVRWRRWADAKAKSKKDKLKDPPTFGGPPLKISTRMPTIPKDVPSMFGEDDRPAKPAKTAKVKAGTMRAASPVSSFRATLGLFIAEFGVARARALVDELETKLLAAAKS